MEIFTKPNNGALQQRYLSGRPNSVSVAADPTVSREEINRDVGFFAQDRWTIDRLTVNAGIRYEVFRAGVGASSSPAGRFVPARNQAAFTVFDFKDALPRFSAVYDLFGNAKTALKFSAGRYVQVIGTTQINTGYSPLSGASDSRNWFDCDLVPGSRTTCSDRVLSTNGDNIAQDNEIAASTNPTFGLRATLRTDRDNLDRESSWDFSASVQHEIAPRVSITAAWYHVREANLWSSNEAAFTLDSFTPFQVVNPINATDTITIYNLKSGVPTGNQVVRSSNINHRSYNGVELSVQARFPKGGALTGGWYADRKLAVVCDTNNPNELRFCDQTGELYRNLGAVPTLPFLHEFKAGFFHPLPWGFQGSISMVSAPGNGAGLGTTVSPRWVNGTWAVESSLFPGGRTVPITVQVYAPSARRLERLNQFDFRMSRRFRAGRTELLPSLDVYNLNNSSVVTSLTPTYSIAGGLSQRPLATLPGRLLRLGVLVKF